MARGRYLSLEEARKSGTLDRFAKEHQIQDPHPDGKKRFEAVLDAMARGTREGPQTSSRGASGGYSETQTPPDTSGDASD